MSTLTNEAREALNALAAADFKIRSDGEDGWWPVLIHEETKPISGPVFNELMKAGFLKGIPNGSGFTISDEGRKAYLKSTDELGDGNVYLTPSPTANEESK